MYKAVGFDLGGVIVYYSIPDSLKYISQKLNVPLDKLEPAYAKLRPLLDVAKIDNQQFWEQLLVESGSKADPKTTEHFWSDQYVAKNPLLAGMLELVDQVKAAGYKVGLLSNIDAEHASYNYGRGIFEHFDAVLLSDEIHARKPEPQAFQQLCDKLEVNMDELIFIDDLPENVVGAKRIGITAIHFEGREELIDQLRRLGIKLD